MYRRNPRADAQRISQVLAGIRYPAAKWQLVMQAEEYGADAATRAELWSIPAESYPDLTAVLAALGLDVGAAERLAQYRTAPIPYPRRPFHPRPAPRVPGRTRPMR